jgi:Tol biopolymer transport system component
MNRLLVTVGLASLLTAISMSAAGASATQTLVTREVVLSSRPAKWVRFEGWITPSEDCRHVAFREQVEGKWRIVRDGTPGHDYDEAFNQSFSPDSEHLAYVARKGSARCVVMDGVEGKLFSAIDEPTEDQWPFVFSPDSAHLAYVAVIAKGKESVVVDGVQGPVFDEILLHSFSFSANSRHFAYAARRGGRGIVVKDGKEVLEADDIFSEVHVFGNTRIGETFGPFLSPDGTRLACAIRRGTNWVAIIDGIESQPWDSIVQLESVIPGNPGFSPDGRQFTYTAERHDKMFVMLDQEELARCDIASYVVFSPDGRRTAFVRGEEKQEGGIFKLTASVVRDGVPGKTFEGEIKDIVFSPDGKKLAYTVTRELPPNREFSFVVVHGGEEFHGISPWNGVVFSPDSQHMAFGGRKAGKSVVVLDGKEFPQSDAGSADLHMDFLAFSPDSKRWAYIARRDGNTYAVISGAEYGPFDYLSEPHARDAYIYFSPDSRHFAFHATRGRQQYLVVDGMEHEIQGEWLSNSLLRFDSSTKLHGLVLGKDNISRIEVEIVEK